MFFIIDGHNVIIDDDTFAGKANHTLNKLFAVVLTKLGQTTLYEDNNVTTSRNVLVTSDSCPGAGRR